MYELDSIAALLPQYVKIVPQNNAFDVSTRPDTDRHHTHDPQIATQ